MKLKAAKRIGGAGATIAMAGLGGCIFGHITHSPRIPALCLGAVGLVIWLAGMVLERAAPSSDGAAKDSKTGIQTIFGNGR